ncbi:MAG: hydrogenase formation protein HypD, partial [Candidatus Bathyarchaeia archaeon]
VATYMLLRQIADGECRVENEYFRTVKPDGNIRAQKFIQEVFEPIDVAWRGFSTIPGSGMEIKREYESYDARKKFEDALSKMDPSRFREPDGCHCGDVLRGFYQPLQCPLFSKSCTPQTPVGPCMVSVEGSCNIEYRYGRR